MKTRYPLVLFCCNDRHGNTTDRVQWVEVHATDGDSLLNLGTYEHTAYAQDEAGPRVMVAGQWFPVCGPFSHMVGNCWWNAAEMDYPVLAALLSHLKAQQWDCAEGEAGLYELWGASGLQFTAEVLETLPGTPTQQAARELRELLVPEVA